MVLQGLGVSLCRREMKLALRKGNWRLGESWKERGKPYKKNGAFWETTSERCERHKEEKVLEGL